MLLIAGAWGCMAGLRVMAFAGRVGRPTRAGRVGLAGPTQQSCKARERALVALVLRLKVVSAFQTVWKSTVLRRAQRQDAFYLQHELPLAVDLMVVAVGAGATPFIALDLAARWAPPHVAARLTATIRHVQFGAPLCDALDATLRHDAALRPLSEILTPAIRLGSPLVPALQRVAADARATHARQMATVARTVPVRLIFPLVLLVLPAFALLTVVPALIAGWRGM